MGAPCFNRRYRAPKYDNEILFDPDVSSLRLLSQSNARLVSKYDFEVAGVPFQQLRRSARAALVDLATRHTRKYFEVANLDSCQPIILAGHQPQWFHPGVWAKNFAIDGLARHVGGIGIQLIIDHDICRSHAIRVPASSNQSPRCTTVPFDTYDRPMPFEFRRANQLELLLSFPNRVHEHINQMIVNPLLHKLWPDVISALGEGKNLAQAFAQGRHLMECRWGNTTLEVPLSVLCETDAFRTFVLHFLQNAVSVRQQHNELLAEYRRQHRIRSRAHPIPDLRVLDGWVETPFWLCSESDSDRRALWCRADGGVIEISDLHQNHFQFSRSSADRVASGESSLIARTLLRGIRPRALTNTLFARLLLGDLFIHGIGGGKYDQITNAWIKELFGVTPPEYGVLSMTNHLPIEHGCVTDTELSRTQETMREMRFHPERFIELIGGDAAQVSRLVKEKKRWIDIELPRGRRLTRHEGIQNANAQLARFLRKKTEEKEEMLQRQLESRRACRVLDSREWAFCLFPEEFLKSRLLELSSLIS